MLHLYQLSPNNERIAISAGTRLDPHLSAEAQFGVLSGPETLIPEELVLSVFFFWHKNRQNKH